MNFELFHYFFTHPPKRYKTAFMLCLIVVYGQLSIVRSHAQTIPTTHPFMLVTPDMYPALRAKANQEPFASMKADAINDCQTFTYYYYNVDADPATYQDTDSYNLPQNAGWRNAVWQAQEFSFYDPTHRNLATQAFHAFSMRDIVSSCALAYILDPSNQDAYKAKMLETLLYWRNLATYQNTLYVDGWMSKIPVGAAFFNTILALDVVYDDLTATEKQTIRDSVEPHLQTVVDSINARNQFLPHRHTINGMWELYLLSTNQKTDTSELTNRVTAFTNKIAKHFTADGIGLTGPGYAGYRFNNIRDSKLHFIDVLEFTDLVASGTFYNDPRYQGFFEWFYGYATTPFAKHMTFGDTAVFYGHQDWSWGTNQSISAHSLRTHKFSSLAAGYAAWKNNNQPYPGRLLHYLLAPDTMPTPRTSTSRIFQDGGAYFIENNADTNALLGGLWNVDQPHGERAEFHAHKDINAVYLGGYGEHLLVNSGYMGGGTPLGFPYLGYTRDRAVANNTLLINYQISSPTTPPIQNDHLAKRADGIAEGFTNPVGFDYASGTSAYSGPAFWGATPDGDYGSIDDVLPNGHHQRNFIFVHPQAAIPGYFMVFDEATADNISDTIHTAWHPFSAEITANVANQMYTANIGVTPDGVVKNAPNKDTFLAIFLATQPAAVEQYPGLLATWFDQAFVGQYLFTTYAQPTRNPKQLLTILFPYDATHPLAEMSRINQANHTGATLQLPSNTIDTAIESIGNQSITHNNTTFQGQFTYYRQTNSQTTAYFVKQGAQFDNNQTPRIGFQSDNPITIYLTSTVGNLIATATTQLTLYHPGLTTINLNGQPLTPSVQGSGWQQLTIGAGTHTLQLIATAQLTPTPDPNATSEPTSTPTPSPTPTGTITVPGTPHGNGNTRQFRRHRYGADLFTTAQSVGESPLDHLRGL